MPSSKPVVVVSGLPRSGTSLMMNMLQAGGIPIVTDALRTADDDNPKGYFELEQVKQLSKGDVSWVAEAEGKAVKVISALLEHLPPSSTYKIVFMKRRLPEVLASQRKMLERRGEPTDTVPDAMMSALFEKHLVKIEGWLAAQANMSVLYLPYHEVAETPAKHVDAIVSFLGTDLGLELDRAKMLEAVDPALYRNRG
ncbi:MAG: sulfotransferase domain-containing protein [Chloroflexi bacterium]|nr:sulfotransferase domain-containing protein [Chloroflexota bacterium]